MSNKIHLTLIGVSLLSLMVAMIYGLGLRPVTDKKFLASEEQELIARIEQTNSSLKRWENRFNISFPATSGSNNLDPLEALQEAQEKIKEMDRVLVSSLVKENNELKKQIQTLYRLIENSDSSNSNSNLPLIALIVSVLAMLPSWVSLFREKNA